MVLVRNVVLLITQLNFGAENDAWVEIAYIFITLLLIDSHENYFTQICIFLFGRTIESVLVWIQNIFLIG